VIANIIYYIINNLGMTFSLIGGLSIFLIIVYTFKIFKLKLESPLGITLCFSIFLNPMMWILSNRYMPDLMGLSIFIIAFYYLMIKDPIKGGFFTGILFGTRLSFFPLLLLPSFYIISKSKKNQYYILSLIMGISIWLLPMIWLTGFENLINVAFKHTTGHFNEYGGTIITEPNWVNRMQLFFLTIWSDGLGGFWFERSKLTLLLSILYIPLIIFGTKAFLKLIRKNVTIKILFYSIIIYIIWILLFQNIIYKSRHVLPIVYFIILILCLGMNFNHVKYRKKMISYMLIVFTVLGSITLNLVNQHKNYTAISQIKEFLITDNSMKTIISIPLVNYYLKFNGVKANYINIESESDLHNINKSELKNNFIVIGNFKYYFIDQYEIFYDRLFFHNPYVNRMWSEIELYEFKNE
tara:strand:+ start:2927 stop:4156 length:1230 start_codon:yes stop_codon:yes gene_type:complete